MELVSGPETPEAMHLTLTRFNRRRLEPGEPGEDWADELRAETACATVEGHFLEAARREVAGAAATAPSTADEFVAWYESLKSWGPGQGDPLFPWLAGTATYEQMRWFIRQEVAGEAGFDDLVALTQIRTPVQVKLELARNYWDEMGHGKELGMHGPMLSRLAGDLEVTAGDQDEVVWEARALGNLLVGLAANRRYAYHALGALGVIELTAPGRAEQVARGLERLQLSPAATRYYRLHATLDIQHSAAWNQEVLRPLVAAQPRVARHIAEGALMRLQAGARCFERYRQELQVPG